MMKKQHRVGIFGGTFNPIHNGHLMIAENACRQFQLEQIVFMPTGHAPHKAYMGADMSSHRIHMTELAIDGHPSFTISCRELENERVSYTYQTLCRLNAEYPDTEFYFILGADSLFDFHLWRHPEIICREAIILAAARDNLDAAKLDAQIASLTEQYGGRIYRIRMENYCISSREIRERIAAGLSVSEMVPPCVMHYIEENRLYRTDI